MGVVIVRHERKSGGDVGDSARGSTAFGGVVDVVLSLRRPPGANARRTVREIHSLSRFSETPDTLTIELTEAGYVSLGSSEAYGKEEARRILLNALPSVPDEALPLDSLLETTELKRTTAQEVLTELQRAGRVARTGQGKRNDPFRFWLHTEPEDDGVSFCRDSESHPGRNEMSEVRTHNP